MTTPLTTYEAAFRAAHEIKVILNGRFELTPSDLNSITAIIVRYCPVPGDVNQKLLATAKLMLAQIMRDHYGDTQLGSPLDNWERAIAAVESSPASMESELAEALRACISSISTTERYHVETVACDLLARYDARASA